MKKTLIYFILTVSIVSQFGHFALAADVDSATSKCIAYWDFENITDNAKTYISKSGNIITGTTNNGIKSYDFIYDNSSNKLLLTAYNIGEISGNASRYFDFLFNEDYNLTVNPATKLVVGFTENIRQHDCDWNFTQSVIMGKSNNVMQMFLQKGTNNNVNYRPNNKSYGHTYSVGTDIKEKYIIDMKNKTFSLDINGKAVSNLAFQNSTENNVSKIRWYPQTGQIYTIDNVYAYIIPDRFDCVKYDGENGSEVAVDEAVSCYFTAPIAQQELSKITVFCNDAIVAADKYQLSAEVVMGDAGVMTNRVSVKFNEAMSYNSRYKVELPSDFTDIAGNVMGESKTLTFSTQASPSYTVSLVCKNSNGSTIGSMSDIIDGKIFYELGVTSTTQRETNGVVIVGLYENDRLVKCAYFKKSYAFGEMQSANGFFLLANPVNMKMKAFVTEELSSSNLYSDTVIFQ